MLSIKEIKLIKKQTSKKRKKKSGTDGFTGEFYYLFKEEIIPILHNFFQKIEAERKVPNIFYEVNTILLKPKPKTYKMEISPMNIDF